MSGYHNNLALHISDATNKGKRRLNTGVGPIWPYTVASVLAVAIIAWLFSG